MFFMSFFENEKSKALKYSSTLLAVTIFGVSASKISSFFFVELVVFIRYQITKENFYTIQFCHFHSLLLANILQFDDYKTQQDNLLSNF